MKKILGALILSAVILGYAGSANAAVISGDFRTVADNSYYPADTIIYERIGASIQAGFELTAADLKKTPYSFSSGQVNMDFNPITNILTLVSKDLQNADSFIASINNILFDLPGQKITGIKVISDNIIVPEDPEQPLPLITNFSYTDNSILLSYAPTRGEFYFNGGTSEFQIYTSAAPVPEPSSILLGLISLGGMFGFKKRSK